MKRRNWKQKKRIKQAAILILCAAFIVAIGIKSVPLFKTERKYGSSNVSGNFSIKMEECMERVEYVKNVKCILQKPELPTGCEATAAAMLLNAYGYPVDKMTMADYLEKANKEEAGGTFYAPHPNEAFIGNPETLNGYGAFPNVIVKAMQKIIDRQDGKYKAYALYGKTEEEILALIDAGTPVCVWSSIDDKEIEYRKGWYLIQNGKRTEEYFYWPSNEHVLVIIGYDDKNVCVCDPMKGVCEYTRESFFRHYEQVGMYAVIMEKWNGDGKTG